MIILSKQKRFSYACRITVSSAELVQEVVGPGSFSKHTTSFRHRYSIHNVKTTLYGRQNNVVCVLGCRLVIISLFEVVFRNFRERERCTLQKFSWFLISDFPNLSKHWGTFFKSRQPFYFDLLNTSTTVPYLISSVVNSYGSRCVFLFFSCFFLI